jgi:3-phenylpropionate/trans-cinnamate dioxygenase ferredoxin reductase subunit
LPASTVIIAVGVAPNVGLAADAGLEVDNGIVVDQALRSSDPDIFAAGDVANAFNTVLGRRIRVEHWGNALAGGPLAARSMMGKDVSYDWVPYFFSDQYDLGMEVAGLPEPGAYDDVVYRGDKDSLEFIAFWLADRVVVAGMNVNIWDVNDDIQALIRAGTEVDVTRLTNPDIPLTDV